MPPAETHTPISAEELAHTFDEAPPPADLAHYTVEDWIGTVVFWMMTGAVFLQFFTRYVLNNSFAWTEEIAVYCLVALVFVGSAACVRTSRHIHVDVLYRFLPRRAGRGAALFVDLVRTLFLGYATWLVWRYVGLVAEERMTTVDLPKALVFYTVFAGFLAMTIRSVQVTIENIRRGYSVLERPEAFMPATDL